ncbi:cell wall-binding repeat-containing protein [Clostridium sp. CX1]|uniref:cell wall-binding repeat-containing protein n=1 Tax=Clostridium sp. CX1 TaxID=2978346 RepID=UPI0021C18B13|nr:cell wall-binding repeat-containing protein [Clostridium sp. CX1]MCT8977937.1 cell wall-binding repeat-containing protein [Clostridium sp. CX1]
MFNNKLALVLCTIGITFSMSTKALASNNTQRIWGSDRYDTAIEISKNGWAGGSEYAVLANGENFPDALSAAPLAKKYNAPILLNPGATLDNRVEDELRRLNVKQMFIIGGTGVVPSDVEKRLSQLNIETTRLFGQDRYETSLKVAEQLDFKGELTVANGENFPDAMSMAPIAAQKSMPIILTPTDKLPDSISKYINKGNITKTYVIGGNDVVSDNIFDTLPNAERLYGDSRYDTNIAVLKKFESELNFNKIYIANGENFPDALAGSVLAAKNSSCVVMVSDYSGQATENFIASKSSSISQTTILGGRGALSDERVSNVLRTRGNTSGNIKNGGSVAEQGDWLYYSFGISYAGEKSDSIYAYKKDGTSKIKLSNKFGKYINVVDDWIYFSRYASHDGPNGIYKTRVNGTEETRLNNDDICSYLTVVGDKIYYVTNYNYGTLFRMNTDGSNKVALGKDSIYSAAVSGNYIYYQNTAELNTLYKMNLDGSGKTKVSDEYVDNHSYIIDSEWVYFTSNSKLYKMRTDGSEKTSIGNIETWYYNISNGWVYYVDKQDSHLYKIKVDGSENIKLSDDNAIGISVDDEWIYYYTMDPSSYTVNSFYRMHLDGSQKELVE